MRKYTRKIIRWLYVVGILGFVSIFYAQYSWKENINGNIQNAVHLQALMVTVLSVHHDVEKYSSRGTTKGSDRTKILNDIYSLEEKLQNIEYMTTPETEYYTNIILGDMKKYASILQKKVLVDGHKLEVLESLDHINIHQLGAVYDIDLILAGVIRDNIEKHSFISYIFLSLFISFLIFLNYIIITIKKKETILEISVKQEVADSIVLKRALSALGQYKKIMDEHSLVSTTDIKGIITYVNDKFCDVSGYTPSELLGQNHRKLNSSYKTKNYWRNMYLLVSKGDVWHDEVRNQKKSGKFYWVDTTIARMTDSDGKITGYISVRTDVTNQKSMIAREKYMSGVMEKSLHEIYIVSAKTNKYIDVNTPATVKTGWSKIEFYEMTPEDVIHDLKMDELSDLLGKDNNSVFETKHRRRNGKSYDIEVHVQRLNGSHDIFIFFIIDITDRLKLRQELEQSQRMKTLGKLSGGIAHDFNNILGAILGFNELVRVRFNELYKDEKIEKWVDNINHAGLRSKDLISHMMSFSRVNLENDGKSHGPIDLKKELSDSMDMIVSSLPSSIIISTDFIDDEIKILLNPTKFHQILMNLCINSRDAMENEGKLHISTEYLQNKKRKCDSCYEKFEGEYIKITVTDDGSGIPDNKIKNIFEPFFTTKPVGKGTGMGLSIVHGIVHDAGGHCTVNSSSKGTSISLLIPIAEGNFDSITDEEPYHLEYGNNKRVLLVDDDVNVGEYFKELLENSNYKVTFINNSMEALEYYKKHWKSLSIIITDQTMPGMLGVDMVHEMIKINPEIKVIICSGNTSGINISDFKNSNVALLEKPVQMDLFYKTLDFFIN